FDPFPSLSNTINGISATFPNKNEAFAPTDAPALYNEALENEDGQRRLATDVKYDLVPYSEQVQQLMKAALAEARRFRKHSGTLPP
ncbi:hypothetical protein ACU6QF_00145, partial [Aeromonas veronii]|uniref:hypothetical protein n=1 Tax=Aeromonas veronii TaxID=654 RepID=UPI00406CFB3E